MKFIPFEKKQKRAQKEINSAKRGDFGNVNPVTKVVESGKLYKRSKQREATRRDAKSSHIESDESQ